MADRSATDPVPVVVVVVAPSHALSDEDLFAVLRAKIAEHEARRVALLATVPPPPPLAANPTTRSRRPHLYLVKRSA